MEGESRLLSDANSQGLDLLDGSAGSFQFTNLPITEATEVKPSLDSIFPRRVTVRAISFRLLPTSATTPAGTAEKPAPLDVEFALQVKKPGDTQFVLLREEDSAQRKVTTLSVITGSMHAEQPQPLNPKGVPFPFPNSQVQPTLSLLLLPRSSKPALTTNGLRDCFCRLTTRASRASFNCASSSKPLRGLNRQDWNCTSSGVQKVGCPFTSFKANNDCVCKAEPFS